VLPDISQTSQIAKSLAHAPHSGSKHGLAQSFGRIHGRRPQPQSTHDPSTKA
jgi:hypothetical protein